ncbi:hypothetical protein ACIB24_08115 [Spongisporangium articulatum]|uniref:Pyridoxamine 5'-phosphate oxidase n=1 Tax=Spongisporangium articulatum TaxID=3362603 RepID=A0ABW8AL03_9ACTN
MRRKHLERHGLETEPLGDGPLEAGVRPLWLVTVTLSGGVLALDRVRYGLGLLNETRAFLVSTRYDEHHAEIRYWDEGDTVAETTRQALELWGDEDVEDVLPGWTLYGLSVVDRGAARSQWVAGEHPRVVALGEIVPFDDYAQLA